MMEVSDDFFEVTVATSDEQTPAERSKADFSTLCRICAGSNEYLIPIFEGEGVQLDLRQKIEKYLPVKINSTDELPTSMCYQCASSILNWHELVENCVEADKQLKCIKNVKEEASDITELWEEDSPDCDRSSNVKSASISSKESCSKLGEDSISPSPVSLPKFTASSSTLSLPDIKKEFLNDVNMTDIKSSKELSSEKFIELLNEADDEDQMLNEVDDEDQMLNEVDDEDQMLNEIDDEDQMLNEVDDEDQLDGDWDSVVVIVDESKPELSAISSPEKSIEVASLQKEPSTMVNPSSKFFVPLDGQYICLFCFYLTSELASLFDHQANEHLDLVKSNADFIKEKAKSWFCAACNIQLNSLESYNANKRYTHPVLYLEQKEKEPKLTPQYLCDICSIIFEGKDKFRTHNVNKHLFNKRDVIDCLSRKCQRCDLCDSIYPCQATFCDHLKEDHPKDVIQISRQTVVVKNPICSLCWTETRFSDEMRSHLKAEHSIQDDNLEECVYLLCRACSQSFPTELEFIDHYQKKHLRNYRAKARLRFPTSRTSGTDRSTICDQCGQVFDKHAQMVAHRERHVLPEDRIKYQIELEESIVIINGETNYQCTRCPRVCEEADELIRHLVLHDKPKSFICHECGFQTSREQLLTRHTVTIHLKKRDHKCDLCPKAFGTKRYLDDHRRIHTGERPWSCKLCDKTFPTATCLYRHKQSHTDYFPFPCTEPGCDKKLRTKSKLAEHMRLHTGHKPYACTECTKAFKRSGDLQKHLTVHTDQRPFVCSVCDRTYKHKKYLRYHMKMMHH